MPEPFGPTSATCSPRSIAKLASGEQLLVAGLQFEALDDDHVAARARRLQELEAERALPRLALVSTRTALIRSICFSFACACFAFEAL